MNRLTRATPALFLALFGCQEPLKDAQRIEEPRLLGVRVTTEDGQASLVPGERASLQVLLAGPTGPLAARLAFTLCEAADSAHGVPFCEGDTLASDTVDLDGSPIAFDVPASAREGAHLLLLGVVCVEGEPAPFEDPSSANCRGGGAALRSSFDVWVAAPDFVNQNPNLAELHVTLGGAVVSLDALDASPSCESDAPGVAADVSHLVEIVLGRGAREPGETLQLSHFSTDGLYERHYGFIAPEQAPETSLEWQAPSAGVAVKHYLVLRDGRGGVSLTSFGVCAR